MSSLIERYKNLVKSGFEYAVADKGSAPTSTFEIYLGHFHDIGCDVEDEITRLRQLLSEAEKREREARAKALEEAAAYHDDLAAQHAASSKEERHHVARDQHAAFCVQHERHAAAIRALQSEER